MAFFFFLIHFNPFGTVIEKLKKTDKLKNSIFEIPRILQALNISNYKPQVESLLTCVSSERLLNNL